MSAAIACRELALGEPPSPLQPTSSQAELPGVAGGTADVAGGTATAGAETPAAATVLQVGHAATTDAVPMRRWPAAQHSRRSSLPDSLDLAWYSSGPESHSVLQRLLRGDWPASIDPHAGGEGGALLNGWAAARPAGRRSPLRRQYSSGRRSTGDDQLLEPFLEEEADGESEPAAASSMPFQHPQQEGGMDEQPSSSSTALFAVQQPAGGTSSTEPSAALLAAQASVYTNASFAEGSDRSSATEQGGLPGAAGGLIDNPSYLSGTSSVRSSLEQQQGSSTTATEPAAQQSSFVNPSFVSGSGGGSSEGEGGGLPAQESSLLRSQVLENPSFVSEVGMLSGCLPAAG